MKNKIRVAIAKRNAAFSKGPVTIEGRERSSRNAIKHGLASRHPKTLCLQNEDQDRLDQMTARWIAKLQPRDEAEVEMSHEIVAHRWRLMRAWEIETAAMDVELDTQGSVLTARSGGFDEAARTAETWKALAGTAAFESLGRYEFRLRRQFERALRDYLLLRGLDAALSPREIEEDTPRPQLAA